MVEQLISFRVVTLDLFLVRQERPWLIFSQGLCAKCPDTKFDFSNEFFQYPLKTV